MPKQHLNISKTTFKKPRKRVFWPWKWSKWPSQRAKFWLKILSLEVIYRHFELKIHPKFGLFRLKIMPKQLLNSSKTTFKKSKKWHFGTPKWLKWPSQRPKIWAKILILKVIYRPFELKTHTCKGLLKTITIRKQLLNISKTTFKNPRKRVF